MPGLLLTPGTDFKKLHIKKLHPTFAAEIEGVDFSQPIPDDVFNEILVASAKVSRDYHSVSMKLFQFLTAI